MAISKFTLKATVVAMAAALSSSAFAVVDMNASPVEPVEFASEIVTTTPPTLLNPSNGLDLKVKQGYAMSESEVRYARFECSSNMVFTAAAVVTSNAADTVGAVNGLGTSVIYFSITAGAGGIADTDTITVNGTRTVSSTGDVSCSYSLYDQPSQAQAGGATGRIVNVADKAYIDFTNALTTTITAAATSTADVAAVPAYAEFDTNVAYAALATINIADAGANDIDGTTLVDGELLAANTVVTAVGDFTAAANTPAGTYTGAALTRVWLDSDNLCSTDSDDAGDIQAGTLSATTATFTIAAAANVAGDRTLCFAGNGTDAIPAATYTAAVNYTAISAAYSVADVAATAAGEIVRNGVTMISPLVQKPEGWLSRMVLVNNGTADRTYTVAAVAEDGNTVTLSGAAAAGTLAAGKTLVLDLPDLVAATGTPRTALVVTVNAPQSQISGLYQIVNPVSGSISNHVMDYK